MERGLETHRVEAFKALREDRDESIGPRKGPSDIEQLVRNENLIQAARVARRDKPLQEKIVGFARQVLETRSSAEKLDKQAVGDLVDNFVIWTVQHDERFTARHQLILSFILFLGMDLIGIEKKIKKMEGKDKTSYNLSKEAVEELYRDIVNCFAENGPKLLRRFLRNASFRDTADADLIPDYQTMHERRREVWNEHPVTAEALARAEINNIPGPKTAFEKGVQDLYIMRLQRGDLSARNRVELRVMGSIQWYVTKGRGGRLIHHYGITEDTSDMRQRITERCMEKLALVDPRRASLETYMSRWIRGILGEALTELGIVRYPKEYGWIASTMSRFPELSDTKIAKRCDVSENLVRFIRKNFYNGYQATSIDQPLQWEDGEKGTLGDCLPGLQSEDPNDDIIARERGRVIQQALAFLPKRDRSIIKLIFYGDKTLEEIGKQYRVTRERIRQIREEVLENLRGGEFADGGPRYERARKLLQPLRDDMSEKTKKSAAGGWVKKSL